MRVFAPRRCVGTTFGLYDQRADKTQAIWGGIPLEGEWIDVPDYFNQVTNGNPINTVVHAKLVDPTGFSYTKWDQTVSYKGKTYDYPQVGDPFLTDATSGWVRSRFVSIAPWITEHSQVLVDPAKNYKGKKEPRKPYVRDVYTRIVNGVFLRLSPTVTVSRSAGVARYIVRGTAYVYACLDPVPDGAKTAKVRYIELGWSFDWVNGKPIARPNTTEAYKHPECIQFADTFLTPVNYAPNRFKSVAEAKRYFLDSVESWLIGIGGDVLKFWVSTATKFYGPYSWNVVQCTDKPIVDPRCRQAFKLLEPEVIGEGLEPLLFRDTANYWRNYLTQHALLQACESLPRLSDNSIQNLCEVVGFVKALVVDHRIEMPKSLADAWLAYRYSYGTGKADVEEAIKFVHRRMDLGTLDRLIVGRGVATHDFDDGTHVVCRCQVEVKPKNVDQLHRIWRALDTYGLTPDFYVVWDSIPYSFMVDWFLPIGDIASVWDANAMYFSGEYYEFSGLCYSLSYIRELDDGNKVKCYTRWAGSVPSSLNGMYWFEPPSASAKTVGKRILDAGSIFIG